ncbi:MAG: hypothetical protein WAJ87_15780, partial [Bryobacteraceae bacterium]
AFFQGMISSTLGRESYPKNVADVLIPNVADVMIPYRQDRRRYSGAYENVETPGAGHARPGSGAH